MAQGGDPLPDADEIHDFFRMKLIKQGKTVSFSINDLEILRFEDDGERFGPLLTEGKIGFRQLAPLTAEYRNLRVYALENTDRADQG